MKNKAIWIGALIGIAFYLILVLLGVFLNPFQPSQWVQASSLGRFLLYIRVILLFPAFIVGFLFWGCEYTAGSFPPCRIITWIISIVIYALIGSLTGLVITKIRKKK